MYKYNTHKSFYHLFTLKYNIWSPNVGLWFLT